MRAWPITWPSRVNAQILSEIATMLATMKSPYLLRSINIRTKFRAFQNRRVKPSHFSRFANTVSIFI